MNVFILDKNMIKSAQLLDDAHLKAQINESCQILMANYNHSQYPQSKIGHIHHPVTKFYSSSDTMVELYTYLDALLEEYKYRFGKLHQNEFWFSGFGAVSLGIDDSYTFYKSKTYIKPDMVDNIALIRYYISTKPQQKSPVWTKRKRPDWWGEIIWKNM